MQNLYSTHFDSAFERLRNSIQRSRVKTNRFKRLGGNKYNISVAENDTELSNIMDTKKETKEISHLMHLFSLFSFASIFGFNCDYMVYFKLFSTSNY